MKGNSGGNKLGKLGKVVLDIIETRVTIMDSKENIHKSIHYVISCMMKDESKCLMIWMDNEFFPIVRKIHVCKI